MDQGDDTANKLNQMIRGTAFTVEDIVEVVIGSVGQELRIAKIFDEFISNDSRKKYSLPLKMRVFHVIRQSLKNNKRYEFIRHIAPRVLYFLRYQAEQIKNDDQMSLTVANSFEQWKRERTFAENFLQTLLHSAKSIFTQNKALIQARSPFKKYSKTFVMKLQDVERHRQTKEIYQSYCKQKDLQSKTVQLQELIKEAQLNPRHNPQAISELTTILDVLEDGMRGVMDDWEKNTEIVEEMLNFCHKQQAGEAMSSQDE